jgi:hypothetical protein
MELPLDIQERVWRMYFSHHVIPEFIDRNLTTDYGPNELLLKRTIDPDDWISELDFDVYYRVYIRWGLRNHKWGLDNITSYKISPQVKDDYDLMYARLW